ncbi:hypothetical protein [Niallia sp. FSL W8-0635]
MKISRRFDKNGDSFEKMFQDLINSKVDDFLNKKYINKTDGLERGE